MAAKATRSGDKSGNPKKGGRSGDTRRPLERIIAIHERIKRESYPNCGQMAADLGVTRKTILRDVAFMRDNLELPIAYDELRHGYHYTKPVGDFPYLRATAEDLVALIVARNALSHLGDTPLVASLRASFQKLQKGMQDRISIPWSDIDHAFSVKATGMTSRDIAVFEKIARAVLERVEVRFDYTKLSAEQAEPRRVQPYHLAEIDGGWYLIGHDLDRDARRTFAVQRMKGLSLSTRKFIRPSDFRLEDHFAGSFGVWTESKPADGEPARRHRIRVRFRGFAARIVPERRWHPTQEIVEIDPATDPEPPKRRPGGRRSEVEDSRVIELRMELSTLEDIKRWILSFGSQAEVLEPKALREWVWLEALAVAGRG